MPDIVSLLDGTTPGDLAPLDNDDLARRGRHRQRRKRASLAGGTALLVVALAAAAIVAQPSDNPSEVATAQTPNGMTLVEPVGSWAAADPPFAPRADAFGGVLSDGRVLVWGGHNQDGDVGPDGLPDNPDFADGGILDPGTGEWTPIPAAPLPAYSDVAYARLVDDRLAVAFENTMQDLVEDTSSGMHIAVYDVAEEGWTVAPAQAEIPDFIAWDGETLALVRVRPRALPGAYPSEAEPLDEALTLRWRLGEADWTTGAPFPLALREVPGQALDGSRLALFGGRAEVTPESPAATSDGMTDGAVYDVESDTWHVMAEGPLSGRSHAALLWSGGRLLVGGGLDNMSETGNDLGGLAAYDPAAGTWEALPAPPAGYPVVWGGSSGFSAVSAAGQERLMIGGSNELFNTSVQSRWYYTSGRWEQAPLPGVLRMGQLFVATSEPGGNPGDGRFGLQVGAAPDVWLDSAEAPFGNRTGSTIVTTDDKLVLIGGYEGSELELKGDAWIFDVSG